MNKTLLLLSAGILSSPLAWAIDKLGIKSFEEVFAISTVMSDSNALTFGIANFDLSYIVDSDNPNWGDQETLDLKKSIDILVVPYTWLLDDLQNGGSQSVTLRAFYLEVQRENQYFQGVSNFEKERVVGGYAQYQQQYALTDNWYGQAGFGLHLMHYENQFNYGEGFPVELQQRLDGNVFNTTAVALIAEPHLNIGYQKQQGWGRWTLHNSNHYIYGQGIGGKANNVSDINPQGWRIINGLELRVDVPNMWGVSDFIAVDFKRIDIGGDMHRISNNGHYYETSIGWVIDTNNKIPLLDNVGIGLNINYGSSISGGTLVLYYNE